MYVPVYVCMNIKIVLDVTLCNFILCTKLHGVITEDSLKLPLPDLMTGI